MHSTNYVRTLILPSPDCSVSDVAVPTKVGTIAQQQYDRLMMSPHAMTSDDLVFAIFAERSGIDADGLSEARASFFSKGQPCLRSSPLVKTYGWAIYADDKSRVALVDPKGALFEELMAADDVVKLAGMRSKRMEAK